MCFKSARFWSAETVAQTVYKVRPDDKRALLAQIVTSRNLWQVLCFVRTKHGASRLARQLEKDGLETTAIHGDKSQQARLDALDAFKAAKVQVMVATDVAARGLDIDDLPLVVNYELPHVPEDYIHRIGRTGRAGAEGEAISFCAPEEEKYLADIERLLKRKIPVSRADGAASLREPKRERERDHAPRARAHSDAAHAARHVPDRNPDQPRAKRQPVREHPPAALTASHTGSIRHGQRKAKPIPALLMKRRLPEPESA